MERRCHQGQIPTTKKRRRFREVGDRARLQITSNSQRSCILAQTRKEEERDVTTVSSSSTPTRSIKFPPLASAAPPPLSLFRGCERKKKKVKRPPPSSSPFPHFFLPSKTLCRPSVTERPKFWIRRGRRGRGGLHGVNALRWPLNPSHALSYFLPPPRGKGGKGRE